MRIDPDCRDPDLLAAEVRRLRAVIESGGPDLTGAERGAIAAGLGALETLYEDAPEISRPIYDAYAPTLRMLLERTRGQGPADATDGR